MPKKMCCLLHTQDTTHFLQHTVGGSEKRRLQQLFSNASMMPCGMHAQVSMMCWNKWQSARLVPECLVATDLANEF